MPSVSSAPLTSKLVPLGVVAAISANASCPLPATPTQNKLDDLTFFSMLSLLQGGMWLLNDLENYMKPFGLSQGRLSILLAITESQGGIVSPGDLAREPERGISSYFKFMPALGFYGCQEYFQPKNR